MDNQTRRRLLKASAAAPFIFTLPNGALLAASSTSCESTSVTVHSSDNDTITAADGTVYEKSGDNYVDPTTGEIYYFNGQSALLSASCWNSIGATSQMRDFW